VQSETKARVEQLTSPAGEPVAVLRFEGDIATTSKDAVLGTYQALPKETAKQVLLLGHVTPNRKLFESEVRLPQVEPPSKLARMMSFLPVTRLPPTATQSSLVGQAESSSATLIPDTRESCRSG